jgi:Fe2+ or Zn2+ uptake regulation protein
MQFLIYNHYRKAAEQIRKWTSIMFSPRDLIRHFKEKGLRITPQRRAIIEILASEVTHPTVDDVYQRVKEIMPNISRSTVYNTLNELVIIGELLNLGDFIEGSAHYDIDTQPHHHLYCERCHKIFDIMENSNAVKIDPEKLSGFKVHSSQVTFYGICPDCRGKEEFEDQPSNKISAS